MADINVRRKIMRSLWLLFAVVLSAGILRAGVFTGEELNRPFVIHGRLSAYNGNPTLRIWIVGSTRILGLSTPEGKEEDLVPKKILDIFTDGDGWFSRDIYGDFTIEPLEPDTKGHMRHVKILDVKNVVIVKEGRVVLMKKEL